MQEKLNKLLKIRRYVWIIFLIVTVFVGYYDPHAPQERPLKEFYNLTQNILLVLFIIVLWNLQSKISTLRSNLFQKKFAEEAASQDLKLGSTEKPGTIPNEFPTKLKREMTLLNVTLTIFLVGSVVSFGGGFWLMDYLLSEGMLTFIFFSQ